MFSNNKWRVKLDKPNKRDKFSIKFCSFYQIVIRMDAGGGPSNGLAYSWKRRDGGTNWISQNIGVHNELHSIQFTDKDNGWVDGSGI